MRRYMHERASTESIGECGTNKEAVPAEVDTARRSFLGRIGRASAGLAMLGLGGETWLHGFSKRSIMSSAGAGESSRMLFASDFEGDVQFGTPYSSGTSCYQDIAGYDPKTGFDWANFDILNGAQDNHQNTGYYGHLITGVSGTNPDNVEKYHLNRVENTTGPHGTQTRAARFRILQNTQGANQNVFGYWANGTAGKERLFARYWLRLEADLAQRLGSNGWMSFWGWKTSFDYRLSCQILADTSGNLRWYIRGDNQEHATRDSSIDYIKYFSQTNRDVPVPVGEWCKVELFYDRNGRGRVWWAVNGTVLFDYIPPEGESLVGALNHRIRIGTIHSIRAKVPAIRDVWLDELEIWDNFASDSSDPLVPPQSPQGIVVSESRRVGDSA